MNKQTQEALKMAIGWAVEVYNDDTCPKDLREAADKVQQACKEAIAQPQPKLFLDLSNSNGNHPVQQEPVEYCKHGVPKGVCTLGEKDCNPAPSWKGLTAKEIASIPLNEYTVQTVERMLKEKNHG